MSSVTAPARRPAPAPPTRGHDAGADGTGKGRLEATFSAWLAIAALAAALVAAPPWSSDDSLPAGFAARVSSGSVEVLDGETWNGVHGGDLLAVGVTVRTGAGARLDVGGGAMELAPGTVMELKDPFRLREGAVLVDAPNVPQRIAVGAVVADGTGTWRVDATAVRRVAGYDAAVTVGPPDSRRLDVDALSQASLAGDQLPVRSLPLRYDAQDAWDRRHLDAVMAIDREAASLERSLDGRFGTAVRPASFFAGVADLGGDAGVLDTFDTSPGDAVGTPADVLLGVAAVRALQGTTELGASDAAASVRDLRRDGATWGIVLGRFGVQAPEFRAAVDATLTPATTRQPPPPQEAAPPAAETDVPSDEPGTTDSGPSEEEAPEPPDQDAPPEPDDDPSEEPPQACQVEPCEPANDVVENLIDLLDDDAPGPAPNMGDVVEDVLSLLPPV